MHAAGAYGLPKLPSSTGYKLYDDFDEEYVFEYPRSWVARSNHQRKGIYFADFNVRSCRHSYWHLLQLVALFEDMIQRSQEASSMPQLAAVWANTRVWALLSVPCCHQYGQMLLLKRDGGQPNRS